MKLTAAGIDCPAGLQPFETMLTGRFFNRPEQRLFTVSDFRCSLSALSESRAKLLLCSELCGVLIPLEIVLHADTLSVTVEAGSIVESSGHIWRLMELSLLPGLMESGANAEGSYLLPVFSGMTVPFRGHAPVRNRDRIYMDRSEWEKFGQSDCVGMMSANCDILGIIRSGAFFAWADSEFNQAGKNRLYVTFGIRHAPEEILPQEDKSAVYRFLPPGGGFANLAFAYREHLIADRGIVPLRERVGRNPVLNYAVHAMRVKIFLGQKHPFESDGASPYVSCTTFAEAGEIIDAMWNAGIRRAVVTLVGWNRGGHDGAYPTRFPVNAEAGGETELKRLVEKALELGYQIVPHDNVTDVYLSAPDYDPTLVSLDAGGERQTAGLWAGGLSYKICPTVALNRFGGEFRRCHRLGFRGAYYLDAQAAGLFRCTDPAHPADEKQFSLSLARIALLPRELFGAVSTEFVPAYMLPYADEASRIPGQVEFRHLSPRLPETLRQLNGQVVPFYQLAVHGLIVYQSEWVHTYGSTPEARLRGLYEELSCGARPAMEVSMRPLCNGGGYRESIEALSESYRINFELCPELQCAFVVGYEETAPNACRIEYDSGHRVEVSWGDRPRLRITRHDKLFYNKEYCAADQRMTTSSAPEIRA